MKLTIEPTDDFYLVEGTRCRAWSGTDDAGTPVVAVIASIEPLVKDEPIRRRFADELETLQPATALTFLLPDLGQRNGR